LTDVVHALALVPQICRHGETRNGVLHVPAAVPDAQRKAQVFHAFFRFGMRRASARLCRSAKNGTNDYYLCYICTGERTRRFIGVWPHIVAHILPLAVQVAWPQIILWLPMTMMK